LRYGLSGERITSGVAGLDEMLGDGCWAGASTVVAGPSGSGKTVLGLHFLFSGARAGELGLMATLQENPSQLERTARGFGWSMTEPNVKLIYRSSVDLYIDEWVHALRERSEQLGARRIVIDSLGDLAFTAADQVGFREYVHSLVQRCARRSVSVLMTLEVADLFHINRLTATP
jgi:circadian clock protein KaiC